MGVYSVRTELGGKKFGYLLVLEAIEKTKPLKWKCQCDCGKVIEVAATSLKCGETKSCGCFRKKYLSELNWKGVGEISGSYFSSIVGGARDRNLEFSITLEQIWELFLIQKRKCALSGVDISFFSKREERSNTTASLDRIDSSKGYTIDNIQWVHKEINFMKQELSEHRFIEWCTKVYENNRKIQE